MQQLLQAWKCEALILNIISMFRQNVSGLAPPLAAGWPHEEIGIFNLEVKISYPGDDFCVKMGFPGPF